MLRIGICEDEPADLAHLREVMEGVLAELEIAAVTEIYDSGERLLAAIQSGVCYDLLLDIYMEGLDGIATARQARMLLPRVQLAFLTTAREFAVEAFDLDAVHYLLKPVEAKGLRVLFERYFSRVRRPVKMLCLENAKDALHLPMQRINKVQSANRGVDIYLEQETQPLFFCGDVRQHGGKTRSPSVPAAVARAHRQHGVHPQPRRRHLSPQGWHGGAHQSARKGGGAPSLQRLYVP